METDSGGAARMGRDQSRLWVGSDGVFGERLAAPPEGELAEPLSPLPESELVGLLATPEDWLCVR